MAAARSSFEHRIPFIERMRELGAVRVTLGDGAERVEVEFAPPVVEQKLEPEREQTPTEQAKEFLGRALQSS